VCKKLIKNSQPFGKKFQKTVGGDFFLTHTVDNLQLLKRTISDICIFTYYYVMPLYCISVYEFVCISVC